MRVKSRFGSSWKALLASLVVGAALAPAAQGAVGGPVILGGDDMPDHGSFNSTTNENEEGWLYMQRALENLSPKVGRANDGSVAAIGSADAAGGAGEALASAASKAGLTVTYHNGATAINDFFTALDNGSAKPRIIWIAGNDSGNDLDGCSGTGTEGEALTANAPKVDAFVNSGGGLMSHGVCYDWLASLLPGLTMDSGSSSGDLYRTPEGQNAFPGVTDADFNAGPWHGHFRGNLGGLQVMVRSSSVDDDQGQDAPVIIGGGSVSLTRKSTDVQITKVDDKDPATVGSNITYTLTAKNNSPDEAQNVVATDDLPAGTSFVSASTAQGSCSGTGPVTCNFGNLAGGASAQATVVLKANQTGQVTNVARVTADNPDPDQANNEARETTQVIAVVAARRDTTRPRAGMAGVRSSCARKAFRVRITARDGGGIRSVVARRDGRQLVSRAFSATTRASFTVLVKVEKLRVGRHTISLAARDTAGNRVTVSRSFRVCAAQRRAPAFTG